MHEATVGNNLCNYLLLDCIAGESIMRWLAVVVSGVLFVSCRVPAETNDPNSSEASMPRNAARTPSEFYVAVNRSDYVLAPLSPNLGQLRIVNGCLVFEMQHRNVMPLFPRGSQLLEVGDRLVLLRGDSRREYTVPGEASLGGGLVALSGDTGRPAQPVPGSCSFPIYVVGKE